MTRAGLRPARQIPEQLLEIPTHTRKAPEHGRRHRLGNSVHVDTGSGAIGGSHVDRRLAVQEACGIPKASEVILERKQPLQDGQKRVPTPFRVGPEL
eukprot:8994792-Alexandrium_andersonii.AAC.1